MLGAAGQVPELVRVVPEVVHLDLVGERVLDVLPLAVRDDGSREPRRTGPPLVPDPGVVRDLDDLRSTCRDVSVDEPPQADPVDLGRVRVRLDPGEVEQGRGQVLQPGDPTVGGAGREARSPDDQGDRRARFVHLELALRDAVLTLHEPVVGGEEEVGVVELAPRRDQVDHLLDLGVDGHQGLPALRPGLGDRGDLARPQPRSSAYGPPLVVDVPLVERRVRGHALAGIGAAQGASDVRARRLTVEVLRRPVVGSDPPR